MRNRQKTLLRDHSVLEVTLKACPKHYTVSAVPENLTVPGPKRPPTGSSEVNQSRPQKLPSIGGESHLGSFDATQKLGT